MSYTRKSELTQNRYDDNTNIGMEITHLYTYFIYQDIHFFMTQDTILYTSP